jgi:hypothetical protein
MTSLPFSFPANPETRDQDARVLSPADNPDELLILPSQIRTLDMTVAVNGILIQNFRPLVPAASLGRRLYPVRI